MVEKPDPDINPHFDWQPVRLVLGKAKARAKGKGKATAVVAAH